MVQALEEMRLDSAKKNKKGIAFILASIFVWFAILVIHRMDMPITLKNLYSWYATAVLMPIALIIMKLLKIKLQNKENPLNQLGLLITMNEMLYILIACWVYSAAPEKMIMVLAMIFGGHLLPFGWLYKSKSYTVSSVLVTVGILVVGCIFPSWVVAAVMFVYEIIFSACLWREISNSYRPSCPFK